METYDLAIVDNHLVARTPAGLALVDTGSPGSIGKHRPLDLLGKRHEANGDPRRILGMASRFLQLDLEWLLGNDILGITWVVLDWQGRALTFCQDPPDLHGASLPIRLVSGIPQIEVEVQGSRWWAYLDTGAKITYVNPTAVAGQNPIRWEKDFYPASGGFETPIYPLTLQVGGRTLTVVGGVLPEDLQKVLPRDTAGWVLGSDFFRDRRVVLDFRHARVVDCPPQETRPT